MLKTIVLALVVVLTVVNLVLLWQIYRKLKQNREEKTELSESYIFPRMTAFGINMAVIGIIGLGKIFLQILFRAP